MTTSSVQKAIAVAVLIACGWYIAGCGDKNTDSRDREPPTKPVAWAVAWQRPADLDDVDAAPDVMKLTLIVPDVSGRCFADADESGEAVKISMRCEHDKVNCFSTKLSVCVAPSLVVKLKRPLGDRTVLDSRTDRPRAVCRWPAQRPDPRRDQTWRCGPEPNQAQIDRERTVQLAGTSWRLANTRVAGDLRFHANGTFVGRDGCNSTSGRWRVRKRALRFLDAGTTLMGCPGTMVQIELTRRWAVATDNAFVLLDARGKEIARYRRIYR